jgi:hypothetical protein
MRVAAAALDRRPDHQYLATQVEAYLERWTARGRCPADDPPEAGNGQSANDQITTSEQGDEPS